MAVIYDWTTAPTYTDNGNYGDNLKGANGIWLTTIIHKIHNTIMTNAWIYNKFVAYLKVGGAKETDVLKINISTASVSGEIDFTLIYGSVSVELSALTNAKYKIMVPSYRYYPNNWNNSYSYDFWTLDPNMKQSLSSLSTSTTLHIHDYVVTYSSLGSFAPKEEYPKIPESSVITSWYKAHLLDKKQNEIIQGKFLEFTNKANPNDVSKVAVVGGGILASGFKGATSTVDSFRVLTNAKLKPGTYKEALDAALGIKNSTPTYNVFGNVNGYKYVGMFKVIPDAVKVEELKQAGDTATGTIASAGGYVLATGKELLMKALGFTFNSQAGLWMMRMSVFLTMSKSIGEIAVTGAEGQILYQRTSTTDVSGMNDLALEKQSAYWDAVNDYYKKKEQEKIDNNETPEDDATEEETEMSELEENQLTNEKLKTALLQTANDYLSQVKGMLDFNYDNIPKKQDILDQDHEEATTDVEGMKKAQRSITGWQDLHSQMTQTHTDVQGNELQHKMGLIGMLAGVMPATLNEHLTRITGKNLADIDKIEQLKDRINNIAMEFLGLYVPEKVNIDDEELSPTEKNSLDEVNKIIQNNSFGEYSEGGE